MYNSKYLYHRQDTLFRYVLDRPSLVGTLLTARRPGCIRKFDPSIVGYPSINNYI